MANDNTQTGQREYDRPPTMREQVGVAWILFKLYAKAVGFFILSLIVTGSLLNIIHPYVSEETWTGLFIFGLAAMSIISIMYAKSLGVR